MSKKTILVIEDNNIMIETYKGIINPLGYEVDVAKTLSAAIKYMKRYDYDLYIIDVLLKDNKKGIEIIGKGGATPDKCIIVSGNLEEKVVNTLINFYKVSRERIMVKPPNIEVLVDLIKTTCSKGEEDEDKADKEIIENIKRKERKLERRIDDLEEQIEPGLIELIKNVVSKLKIKHWCLLLLLMIIIPTSLSTYTISLGYKRHVEIIAELDKYCETRFKHFRKGDTVSSREYTEKIYIENDVEYTLRVYPDNFMLIILTSENNEFEPYKYWVPSPAYTKKIQTQADKEYFEIVLELLKTSR